jgi:hypothetical protein
VGVSAVERPPERRAEERPGDVERVRKTVKKIGQEMLADPELGRELIQPLKLQGVADVLFETMPDEARPHEAAHAFIDYILRPDVSKLISEKFPYTNPNGEARKLLSKDQLDNPASYPKNPPKLDIFHDMLSVGWRRRVEDGGRPEGED